MANNHTLDAGPAGEVSTDDALRAAGLRWAGRPGQITYLTRNGIKIALLGFAPWSYDADALDIPAAEALVRQAKRHAQVVIVMEHLGGEGDDYRHVKSGEEYFLGQDRGNSIAFTHGVINAGADLVMGSGPHVLRGFQWYHGHLIAYSLGNFCGYNTLGLDAYTSVSAILHVTLNARGQFVRGSITPLRLVSPGLPERDPDRTAVSYINSLSHGRLCRERGRPALGRRQDRQGVTTDRAAAKITPARIPLRNDESGQRVRDPAGMPGTQQFQAVHDPRRRQRLVRSDFVDVHEQAVLVSAAEQPGWLPTDGVFRASRDNSQGEPVTVDHQMLLRPRSGDVAVFAGRRAVGQLAGERDPADPAGPALVKEFADHDGADVGV